MILLRLLNKHKYQYKWQHNSMNVFITHSK